MKKNKVDELLNKGDHPVLSEFSISADSISDKSLNKVRERVQFSLEKTKGILEKDKDTKSINRVIIIFTISTITPKIEKMVKNEEIRENAIKKVEEYFQDNCDLIPLEKGEVISSTDRFNITTVIEIYMEKKIEDLIKK